jgi:hypothetical protein
MSTDVYAETTDEEISVDVEADVVDTTETAEESEVSVAA